MYQSDNIIRTIFYSNQWNSNQIIYLIIRNWINCFFNLFNYNEINNALNQYLSYPQQNINYEQLLETIYSQLSEATKLNLNNLDQNIGILNNDNLYILENTNIIYDSGNFTIFTNFYLVENNFYNTLMNYGLNAKNLMAVETSAFNGKIILYINNNIYIGKIDEKNFFYKIKAIITYINPQHKNEIIKLLYSNKNYMNYLLFIGDYIPNKYNIFIIDIKYKANIINSSINEKLKAFIKLNIYQKKLV